MDFRPRRVYGAPFHRVRAHKRYALAKLFGQPVGATSASFNLYNTVQPTMFIATDATNDVELQEKLCRTS